MKLPFTWILSSWWQNNTNTIRTTLNMTEKRKKNYVCLLKRQKLGSNQSTFATFSPTILPLLQYSLQRVWNYLSHDHCQVCGKLLQTPSERLWTWPKNQKKFLWFLLKRQKPGSNQSNIATFSDKKLTKLSIVIAKSMKLPFEWILSSWWQNNTNTIRTTLNLTEKSKKIMFFY